MNMLKNLVVKYLQDAIDNIEDDNCELTEEQLRDILHLLAHRPLSKEQACDFLHMSRSVFDTHVRNGELPKGKKRSGFKELVWYEDELEQFKLNNK